jgi:hypothetical protein
LTKVAEMTGLGLLDQTFPDARPAASGKHKLGRAIHPSQTGQPSLAGWLRVTPSSVTANLAVPPQRRILARPVSQRNRPSLPGSDLTTPLVAGTKQRNRQYAALIVTVAALLKHLLAID